MHAFTAELKMRDSCKPEVSKEKNDAAHFWWISILWTKTYISMQIFIFVPEPFVQEQASPKSNLYFRRKSFVRLSARRGKNGWATTVKSGRSAFLNCTLLVS